jgi:4-hydroxy-tetrahydrodipicolinate reductase
MKKLAIVGYGKMGRMIEQLAPQYNFEIQSKVDIGGDFATVKGSDVAIEFTEPNAIAGNVEKLAALRVPIVVGTTGWAAQMDRVRAAIATHDGLLVWAPNFSVGVTVFSKLVSEAARLLANEPEYEAWAWEIHHSAKKDAQSGTLLKLVDDMKRAGYTRAIDASSNRAGAHPGTHEIGFDSAADTITLRHTARNRDGFARGALKAAQWIVDHPDQRGVFEFGDILFRGQI